MFDMSAVCILLRENIYEVPINIGWVFNQIIFYVSGNKDWCEREMLMFNDK